MKYENARICCMKKCKSKIIEEEEGDKAVKTSLNNLPTGCFYDPNKDQCLYNTSSASVIPPSNQYTHFPISQCLSEEINQSKKKLQEKNNEDIINNEMNLKNKKELVENSDTNYKKGLVIGGIVTIVLCIVTFIFAKLKLIPLIYNQILDYLENNRVEFIIVCVILLLIITFISYLTFIVHGGKGKKGIINGTMNLTNYLSINNTTKMLEYDNFEMDDDNQTSYIFWLKINEDNKQYNNWQHIFHVGTYPDINIQYPGVWFEPAENILRIVLAIPTIGVPPVNIDIDNIPFEEWLHIGIVINNNSTNSTFAEVYINSKLITTKLLEKFKNGLKNPQFKDSIKIYVGGDDNNDTISGSISDLFNYNNVLSHMDIESHYMSILVTTTGYLMYILKIIKSIVMYPKNLLFHDYKETC